MSSKKIAWSVFGLVAVLMIGIFALQTARSQRPVPDPTPTGTVSPGAAPQRSEASPSTSSSASDGFQEANPNGPQAPGQYAEPSQTQQKITQPAAPKPDPQDAKEVAEAFLTMYNSRPSESDKSWQASTKPWTTPELAQNLTQFENAALKDKGATAVTKVKITGNVADWGRDTPVRWAHTAEVTVKTESKGTFILIYRMRAQLTEEGWLLNAAYLDSWRGAK